MIKGLRRLEATTVRVDGEGDNWHMTWADDDRQYVSLCDGSGFPGTPRKAYNSRAYAIAGTPPDITFAYLPGYPDLINVPGTRDISRYYWTLAKMGFWGLFDPFHVYGTTMGRFRGSEIPTSCGVSKNARVQLVTAATQASAPGEYSSK
jgi:hypothetical protein